MLPRDRLADEHRDRFEHFAQEVQATSPLYERLSLALAQEPVAEDLMLQAPPSQRRPNLLFAAVHDLLLAGTDHPLASLYPTVLAVRHPDLPIDELPVSAPSADHAPEQPDLIEAFLDVLITYQPQITQTMRTRHTQTNEAGRGAALWPGLRRALPPQMRDREVALIELGCSAGLLLHLDRYGYPTYEPSDAAVQVETELIDAPPEMPPPPTITRRIGIESSPLDVNEPADVRWLMACIWPEDVGRLRRTRAAAEVARRHDDIEVVHGDLVTHLPQVLADLPAASVPCIFHSAAFAYLDPEERETVTATIEAAATERDLLWLSYEGPFIEPFQQLHRDTPPIASTPEADMGDRLFLLGATVWLNGQRTDRLLARGHGHVKWIHHLDVWA